MQPSFAQAADVLHSYLQEQPPDISAQVCVIHRGKIVLDIAGSSPASSGITIDTPFITFSVSKAFTAAAIWHLLDTGKIKLDAPIAHYWPEFGQKGKATATIRHALLHQADIPAPHLYSQILAGRPDGWSPCTLPVHKLNSPPGHTLPATWSISVSSWGRWCGG